MEIGLRLGLERKAYYRVIASLRVALKKVAEIRLPTLQDSISVDMFASGSLPHEAARTYRTIMTEFEVRRARILKEARGASFRPV